MAHTIKFSCEGCYKGCEALQWTQEMMAGYLLSGWLTKEQVEQIVDFDLMPIWCHQRETLRLIEMEGEKAINEKEVTIAVPPKKHSVVRRI